MGSARAIRTLVAIFGTNRRHSGGALVFISTPRAPAEYAANKVSISSAKLELYTKQPLTPLHSARALAGYGPALCSLTSP